MNCIPPKLLRGAFKGGAGLDLSVGVEGQGLTHLVMDLCSQLHPEQVCDNLAV